MENRYELSPETQEVYIYTNERAVARGRLKEPIVTKISIEDLPKLHKLGGSVFCSYNKTIDSYYACVRVGKKNVLLHRYLLDPPDGMVVDHISRDSLDNTRGNLRVINQRENLKNRNTWGASRIKGVRASQGKYEAVIHIGTFTTESEASDAVRKARKCLVDNGLMFRVD